MIFRQCLIFLSILLYTTAYFTNNNLRELDTDEILQVLGILSGMSQQTSGLNSSPEQVVTEQLVTLPAIDSTTEFTIENSETTIFNPNIEPITINQSEDSTIAKIIVADAQETKKNIKITTLNLIDEKNYHVPTSTRVRRSSRERSHLNSHKFEHAKNKQLPLSFGVERLLRGIPDLNVTEPWEIDTEILYGPGNSIQIHINVTAIPKPTTEINYTASQIKHVKYWEAVAENKKKAEEINENKARRRFLVPYPLNTVIIEF